MTRRIRPTPIEVRRLRRFEDVHGLRSCLVWREVDGRVEVCRRDHPEHDAPHESDSGWWWNGQSGESVDLPDPEPAETLRDAPVRPSAARYDFRPIIEPRKVPWTPTPIMRSRFDPESVRSGTVAAAMVGEMGF